MTTATRLAALAAASSLGIRPQEVVGPVGRTDGFYDCALVIDDQQRRWVIRCPVDDAASGLLAGSARLTRFLDRHSAVPVAPVVGWAPLEGSGRASMHQYIEGVHLELGSLGAGTALAAELGRILAAVHNVSRALCDEAGLASYSADQVRQRKLTELDHAASTGRIPALLLQRWERGLEDPTLWKFVPTLVHGGLRSGRIVARLADGGQGRIVALTGWESACVGDPADDLAAVIHHMASETADTVFEAYAAARELRPDDSLARRVHLAAEMSGMATLMRALARAKGQRESEEVEQATSGLASLADRIEAEAAIVEHRRAAAEARLQAQNVPTVPTDGSAPSTRSAVPETTPDANTSSAQAAGTGAPHHLPGASAGLASSTARQGGPALGADPVAADGGQASSAIETPVRPSTSENPFEGLLRLPAGMP